MGSIVKMIGSVTEYNPFHNGHKKLLEFCRNEPDGDVYIAVMSGDFVQRGEPAVFDKFSRAEKALKNGVDLIVELPIPWSLSSAEHFAFGGVKMLEALGVDRIAFGSECGDIDELEELAVRSRDSVEEIKAFMKDNPDKSYPKARREVLDSSLLDEPNNILGIEYLKAASVPCITIKRENSKHDGINSAMEIREEMRSFGLGTDYTSIELAAVSRLRMFDRDYFNSLPDSSDGAGNRLYDAVREFDSLDDICAAAKTKSITMSAVRRLCWCAVLGIKEEMNAGIPPYVRVLGFNERGRSVLKRDCAIPVITQAKQIYNLDIRAREVFAVGASAHDLFCLGFRGKMPTKCGNDYRFSPVIV